jgi:hypothetical protein
MPVFNRYPVMQPPAGRPIAAPISGPVVPQRPPVGTLNGQVPMSPPLAPMASRPLRSMGSFKKGGKVKRTGLYKLHAGEEVVPRHKVHATGVVVPMKLLLRAKREKGE